jgi:hypothetical protein
MSHSSAVASSVMVGGEPLSLVSFSCMNLARIESSLSARDTFIMPSSRKNRFI